MRRPLLWTIGWTLSGCPCPTFETQGAVDTADTGKTGLTDSVVMTPRELQTFYLDYDGDGFGDDARTLRAWTAPEPYVTVGGDCQDTSALVHPDAAETCNGIDDDCDDATDDEDPDVSDQTTWYRDGDADGYGDAGWSVLACTQPNGAVEESSDCEDGDGEIHPEAMERCGDGVDSDCSGTEECNITDAVSETSNPNPPWSLGWSTELDGSDFIMYSEVTVEGTVFRWLDPSKADALSVSRNADDGELSLHPGPAGEYSRIRWTAFEAASCTFEATFSAVDVTTSYVHVYYIGADGAGVISDEIWSIGDTATLSSSVDVEAGDTIDFIVDYGSNGTYYADATGLEGQIVCVPLWL